MNVPVERMVLNVEDDPADAILMQRAWEKSGARCSLKVVTDGQEAMDYLEGQGSYGDRSSHPLPHYLILDLKLPRKTGIEDCNR